MTGNKDCKKCGKKELGWDKMFHMKTGKWKLENHKNKEGKWCNKPPEEIKTLKKWDIHECKLCLDSNFGGCRSEDDYARHMSVFHPNNEKLTTLDYMIMFGMNKNKVKFWKSDPHYSKHVETII